MLHRMLIAASALALALVGCSHNRGLVTQSATGEVASENAPASLLVHNRSASDVDVFVIGNGTPLRIGTVVSNTTMRFRVDRSYFPTNQLRILGRPIGSSDRVLTDALNVMPGQTIDFEITPLIQDSNASVQ